MMKLSRKNLSIKVSHSKKQNFKYKNMDKLINHHNQLDPHKLTGQRPLTSLGKRNNTDSGFTIQQVNDLKSIRKVFNELPKLPIYFMGDV